ncbi:hypothetical protein LR010_02125 [Candidatus Gracilibacteria bacterium]|nr:hypothetical protein [Candidatus Gracilibacteria bacterium]
MCDRVCEQVCTEDVVRESPMIAGMPKSLGNPTIEQRDSTAKRVITTMKQSPMNRMILGVSDGKAASSFFGGGWTNEKRHAG